MARSILRIIMSHVIGFLIFLILLSIANFMIPSLDSSINANTILFFNDQVILFMILMLVGMVNEIFWSFWFPFNILAPLTGALLSILVINLVQKILGFIGSQADPGFMNLARFIGLFYFFVPIIVIIAGYALIISRGGRPGKEHDENEARIKAAQQERKSKRMGARKKNGPEMIRREDIGNEFKIVLHNLADGINVLVDSAIGRKRSRLRKKDKKKHTKARKR